MTQEESVISVIKLFSGECSQKELIDRVLRVDGITRESAKTPENSIRRALHNLRAKDRIVSFTKDGKPWIRLKQDSAIEEEEVVKLRAELLKEKTSHQETQEKYSSLEDEVIVLNNTVDSLQKTILDLREKSFCKYVLPRILDYCLEFLNYDQTQIVANMLLFQFGEKLSVNDRQKIKETLSLIKNGKPARKKTHEDENDLSDNKQSKELVAYAAIQSYANETVKLLDHYTIGQSGKNAVKALKAAVIAGAFHQPPYVVFNNRYKDVVNRKDYYKYLRSDYCGYTDQEMKSVINEFKALKNN